MEVKCFGSRLTTEFSAQQMLAAITFIVAVVLGPSPANLLFFTPAFKEALLLKFAPPGILFPSFPPIFSSTEGQPSKQFQCRCFHECGLVTPVCELSLFHFPRALGVCCPHGPGPHIACCSGLRTTFLHLAVLTALPLGQGLVADKRSTSTRRVSGTKCCDGAGREEISIRLGPSEESSGRYVCAGS